MNPQGEVYLAPSVPLSAIEGFLDLAGRWMGPTTAMPGQWRAYLTEQPGPQPSITRPRGHREPTGEPDQEPAARGPERRRLPPPRSPTGWGCVFSPTPAPPMVPASGPARSGQEEAPLGFVRGGRPRSLGPPPGLAGAHPEAPLADPAGSVRPRPDGLSPQTVNFRKHFPMGSRGCASERYRFDTPSSQR